METISGILVFREGTDQPSSPKEYCKDILYRKLGSNIEIKAYRIAGVRTFLNIDQAKSMYNTGKSFGSWPDWGEPSDAWTDKGSDKNNITVLIFE
jgi:hypothetical protein